MDDIHAQNGMPYLRNVSLLPDRRVTHTVSCQRSDRTACWHQGANAESVRKMGEGGRPGPGDSDPTTPRNIKQG